MNSIVSKLEAILGRVENPARYIGGEANGVRKDKSKMVGSIALVFPDTYEVGMSNNGYRILNHVVNAYPDLLAEHAFAPWLDMGKEMREAGIPVYTHESYTGLAEFDIIGLTLQTELNYTNIPYILELSNVPVWSAERGDEDPFVIGGGPCSANPEPVADFYDAFVIGDGEIVAPQIVRTVGSMRRAGKSREEILIAVADIPGMYVPSLMQFEMSPNGEYLPTPEQEAKGPYKRTKGVKRTWVEVLDKANYPIQNLIPNAQLVHERYSVEVMRGCTQGCRFCQAGYWYRPNRELNPDHVIELAKSGLAATGERELGLLSLSTADYSQIENVADLLIDDEYFTNVDVSLPSLRANSFGQGLAEKVAAIKGGRSATFAPETGSERLRKIINKTISDQEMYDAAEGVFKAGFTKIKLYTMVGIPTENLEDMEAFCGLIEGLVKIGRKYNPNAAVHASVGVMVPKPFTPMQWVGLMEQEKVEKHIRFVRERFYKNRNVRISWTDWREAHVESMYSRGDRSLGPLIYAAYQKGIIFESYRETFSYEGWQEVWEEHNYDQNRIFRERNFDEVFPWDYIHAGLGKGFLKNEYKKMFIESSDPVKDCKWSKDDCNSCGIPGNYADIQIAEEPTAKAPNRNRAEVVDLFKERRDRERDVFYYRLIFSKTGLARFLPHQNTINFIKKSFGRLKIDVNYSKGFSPKPLIRSNGAIPMGIGTECEDLIIELLSEVPSDKEAFLKELNRIFPKGLRVVDISLQEERKPRMATSVTFSWKGDMIPERLDLYSEGKLPVLINHRKKEINVQEELLDLTYKNGELLMKSKTNVTGVSVSPYILLAGVLGIDQEEIRSKIINKVAQEY